MSTSILERRDTIEVERQAREILADHLHWRGIYRIGAIAGTLMLATIPLAILAYVLWPPPFDEPASEWFAFYQQSWLQGMLGMDLLFLISNVLMIPLLVTLYIALRRVSESLMAVALAIGLVSIATYFSSNVAIQMLLLSNRHETATSDAERAALLAAGEAMLATFEGSSFSVYYVLSAIALLIIATVMLRSTVFSRRTAYIGLSAGVLMLIPANAGTLGAILSFASLIPWVAFLVLVVQRFWQLSRETAAES